MALSTFELKARQNRLLAEQKARDEKRREKERKEAEARERQRQREAAREEELRQRRLAEQAAAEQAERQREELTEWNRGVFLQARLQAVDADDAAAAARGIKRAADKVTLPASFSPQLMDMDAAKNGPIFFRLTSAVTGHTTHAGVLEFAAPEGVVLLPRKVRECLFGPGSSSQGLVDVQYRRLEKGSFVRFQPLTRGFHEAVGDDVRGVLEASLSRHSALTQGDTVRVEAAGAEFDLLVTELRPEAAVSIIDTDVEAEVVASVETEALIAAHEAEAAANAARLAALRAEMEAAREAEEAAARAAEEQQRVEAEAAAQAAAAEEMARAHARAAAIAAFDAREPEPSPQSAGGAGGGGQLQPVVACAFRLPDGKRLTRRFRSCAPLVRLWEFVDSRGAGGLAGPYALVSQFPRRTLYRPEAGDEGQAGGQGGTLEGAGLGAQEMFLLEPLEAPEEA